MLGIFNTNNIYDSKTKEYFKEVVSDYASENYRSANVVLYSVAICDLLFKLKELSEIYDDKASKAILKVVDESISDIENPKEKWESVLIEEVYKSTSILDRKAYEDLLYLKKYRNLSAHPSLDSNYELVSITQENTANNIRNTLNNILTKSPLLSKKSFDLITNELDKNRYMFQNNQHALSNFLNNTYYSKMDNTTRKELYKIFWKFCFNKPDDECALRNLTVNRKALFLLHVLIDDIEVYIADSKLCSQVSDNKECLESLCYFLAEYPLFYNKLSETTKHNLKNTKNYALLSWFATESIEEHIDELLSKDFYVSYSSEAIEVAEKKFLENGYRTKFLDFTIKWFGLTPTFNGYDTADYRFNVGIRPNLKNYSKEQFNLLMEYMNNNNQIYGRSHAKHANAQVIKSIQEKYPDEFDYAVFENIDYIKDLVD